LSNPPTTFNGTPTTTTTKKKKKKLKSRLEFYGVLSGRDATPEDALQSIESCIREVLGVDVRSVWHTQKARSGRFQAERSRRIQEDVVGLVERSGEDGSPSYYCTQQLDNLLIKYTVHASDPKDEETKDSTAAQVGTPDTNPSSSSRMDVNTNGSGADDTVIVHGIQLLTRDWTGEQ